MDVRNVRVKNYIEELQDTSAQDAKIVSALFIFLSVNATKLTSSALGYLVGGVQALKTPSSSNVSIFQKLKHGGQVGSAKWANSAAQYQDIVEISAGIPGAIIGNVGGVIHGTGKFFVNKCKSSRPVLTRTRTRASSNFIEMSVDETQDKAASVRAPGRYVI
jgi:hypothetical protein